MNFFNRHPHLFVWILPIVAFSVSAVIVFIIEGEIDDNPGIKALFAALLLTFLVLTSAHLVIDFYHHLEDRYRLHRFAQNRRTRYRLFREWVKDGVVSEGYFEHQAKRVIE